VYSKVSEAFGGRVRIFVVGGAPLGIDTANWFASVGIALWEGYGLTETSPVIALNTPLCQRLGSVGRPLPNVELKFAADGELMVRGPAVFEGYWHKPEANAECFDQDGWFRTGDIGHLDADGFLFITDRKKELLKTSGGKLVAPQPIESKLKTSLLVAQAALVGDKHKFISALIAPNFAALEDWARHHGIEATSRAELVANRRVVAQYGEIVRVVNGSLANFETVKRFRVVAEEWTQDSGELTPSMKLKRRVITDRYAAVIEALYADEATARGE
jgi:long-chain acyl-CoA synthetase